MALPEGREASGGPYGWLGVWKPTQKGQEESGVPHGVQEGSQAPPGGPGGVKRPSWWEGRGLGALLESREGLRGPKEVGSLSERARSGREAHP